MLDATKKQDRYEGCGLITGHTGKLKKNSRNSAQLRGGYSGCKSSNL
jgi:hypothetical protein